MTSDESDRWLAAILTPPLPYRHSGGACVVRGGVVGAAVATVEVVTAVERHQLEVDPASGAFVALAPLGADGAVELIARDADGMLLDSASSEISAADWAEHDDNGPRPLPAWLRPAVDAVIGDLRRSGGGPADLVVTWTPDGRGAVIRLGYGGAHRWSFGIDRLARGAELLVALAGQLQDGWGELPDVFGTAHPACPGHSHPAAPVERDGVAWWTCPADGRPLAQIGAYDSPRQSGSC